MPARIRSKSLPGIAREGFLDRRSKRCFWLLLSPIEDIMLVKTAADIERFKKIYGIEGSIDKEY